MACHTHMSLPNNCLKHRLCQYYAQSKRLLWCDFWYDTKIKVERTQSSKWCICVRFDCNDRWNGGIMQKSYDIENEMSNKELMNDMCLVIEQLATDVRSLANEVRDSAIEINELTGANIKLTLELNILTAELRKTRLKVNY